MRLRLVVRNLAAASTVESTTSMAAVEPMRVARTESLFRDVNERIAETAKRLGAEYAEFVCECADPECGERFQALLEEYEEVRSSGACFLVAPGHEEPKYERTVERSQHHRVVEKDKDPRVEREVSNLDPRASS
jgi:hypothetical protein